MASIKQYQTKKGAKPWMYQVYGGRDPITRKQIMYTKRGFNSKRECTLAAHNFEEKLFNHGFSDSNKLTFIEVYESWFKLYKNTVKESTWVKTREIFQLHILPVFGNKLLTNIKTIDCQHAIDTWFSNGLTKYKVFMNNVARLFKYAIRMKLLYENPVDNVIRPQNKNRPLTTMSENYYDREELKKFLSCLYDDDNPEAYAYFRLSAFSGLRKGELLALTYSDIDFTKMTVTINKTQSRGDHNKLIIQTPKTYDSNRIVYIDKKTSSIIQMWQLHQRKELLSLGYNTLGVEQLIFTNNHNGMLQPNKPREWLQHTINKYDLKNVSCHGFRRTFATLCFEAGLSIKQVQAQLGHRDANVTLSIYTELSKTKKNEIADTFSRYANF